MPDDEPRCLVCTASDVLKRVSPVTAVSPHDQPVQELAHHWRALVQALMAEPRDLPRTAEAALTYVYYWYNFMPLARGTAVVGYITLLALFLAAGMPITVPAPPVGLPIAAMEVGRCIWEHAGGLAVTACPAQALFPQCCMQCRLSPGAARLLGPCSIKHPLALCVEA